jgi:hypothetical protein
MGERKLHKLSETELVDGELFFVVFASKLDGESTVRTIPTDQIKDIITLPGDASIPLYYRREYTGRDSGMETLYYPDWHATPEQLAQAKLPADARKANEINQSTDVVVLHAAFRETGGRGWPLGSTGMDWEREYSGFLKDRAAVAKSAASITEKIKTKGGQRAIDMIRSRLGSSIPGSADSFETNPPPVAGSVWLENDAMSREWMNRPTGASDAEKDGVPLITQVGLALKLYPHYLGRGDYFRLATATSMEGPTLKSFNRYQAFWSSVWRDLFKIVVDFKTQYGGLDVSSMNAQISTDRIINLTTEEINAAMNIFTGLVDRGLISGTAAQAVGVTLMTTALETIGVQGVNEMVQAKAAEVGEGQSPFEEKASGIDRYRQNLRAAVYGLWSGQTDRGEFQEQFELAVDVGLRRAWHEGIADLGLQPEDMTQDEQSALSMFILGQFDYVDGFADFIEANSKAAGGKMATLQTRLSMWVNRYNDARNQAKLTAEIDPPLTWEFGPTEEHCDDCAYARGKTYRASIWKKWGWEPQSRDLECSGYLCQCFYAPADQYTKLTKGHPRRPKGHK